MNTLHFLLPGDPQTRTGGYIYDARMITGLRASAWHVELMRLHDGFPFPNEAMLAHAAHCLQGIADHSLVLIDGLAFGAMPELAHAHAHRLKLLALVHHPLAAETGLSRKQRDALLNSERHALRHARHVIVTSAHTAAALRRDYDVAAGKLSVVAPGTDVAHTLASPDKDDVLDLLCVATVTPRKGHQALVEALAPLAGQRWLLRCVGSLTRSPDTVRRLRTSIHAAGLDEQVQLLGEFDDADLQRSYCQADAFVLATRLEGYGMALAEALAHGLPIVTTAGGAAADTVGDEAALLVPSDDIDALSAALRRLLCDPALRGKLAAAARRRALQLPSWKDAALSMQKVLKRLQST